MKEIGVKRAIEEVSIDGKQFEIDLSDDKKQKYLETGARLKKVGKELEEVADIEDEQTLKDALDKIKKETEAITTELLGEGAFDYIYEKTNESSDYTLMVLSDVQEYIFDRQQELYKEKFEKKKAKYVKKKR